MYSIKGFNPQNRFLVFSVVTFSLEKASKYCRTVFPAYFFLFELKKSSNEWNNRIVAEKSRIITLTYYAGVGFVTGG